MYNDVKKNIDLEKEPEAGLALAVELFHSGKIFIYPTDTIYGIGGNPFNKNVARRISEIKGREESKQFIWLLSEFETLFNYIEIKYEQHINFLQKIWPGPVSVIFKLNKKSIDITGLNTIAVRIPDDEFCKKLLMKIKKPLVSTSVNTSGSEPLVDIKQIIENFSKRVDAVFYHNQTSPKIVSTIIDLTNSEPKLVREGSINYLELLQYFN